MITELEAEFKICLKTFLDIHHSRIEKLIMQKHYWLACGSTKTGIETALSECCTQGKEGSIVMDYHNSLLKGKLLLGLTYSGNSTEVTDFIPAIAHQDSIIITSNDHLNEAHLLPIDTKKIPLRYLPLLTHKLVQSLYGKNVLRFDFSSDLETLLEPVFETLRFSYINNRIPIFTSDNNSWFARLFAEQYMECLKRPAFYINYPNFTHNLLWTLSSHNIEKFCFIHENSQYIYTDNRQKKTIKQIDLLGGIQTELSFNTKIYDVFLIWLLCIKLYDRLCKFSNLNMNAEYSFKVEDV